MTVAMTAVLTVGGRSAREPAFLAQVDHEKDLDCEAVPEVDRHHHEVPAMTLDLRGRAHDHDHDRNLHSRVLDKLALSRIGNLTVHARNDIRANRYADEMRVHYAYRSHGCRNTERYGCHKPARRDRSHELARTRDKQRQAVRK